MNGKFPLTLCVFIAYLFISSSSIAHSQEQNSILKLDVVGNIDAHLVPGERTRVLVSALADGFGELQLKIAGEQSDFFDEWDRKRINCSGECQVEDTLYIQPTEENYGRSSFNIVAFFWQNGSIVDKKSRRVRIKVAPKLTPEPPFTAGSVNQLCWQPFDSRFDYELFRFGRGGFAAGAAKNMIAPSAIRIPLDSCDVVEGLLEGVRYSYHVVATEPQSGQEYQSNIVYSIQDRTPPPAATIERFFVGEDAVVRLDWRFRPDAVSYVDNYVVLRKNVSLGGVFEPVDTLHVFPAKINYPVNYYPVPAKSGEAVYVEPADSLFGADVGKVFRLGDLPLALEGSALIKASIADRWNESDEFLSMQITAESEIYIGFDIDARNLSLPNWLTRSFEPVRRTLELGDGNLRLYKSKTSYGPGKLTLGGNYANGARLTFKEPLMYLVFVKPVNELLPFAGGEWASFSDSLGVQNDGDTFKYRLIATDAVGNTSEGGDSPPIVFDVSAYCRPQLTSWFTFEGPGGIRFGKGFGNEICTLDSRLDARCLGFRDSDSLRFQAVRESVLLFDKHESDDVGKRFFDSGWLDVAELGNSPCYNFNFLSGSTEPDFVNGKRYFYRVQSKDQYGNTSSWSDTVMAIQDAFPPDDVSSLTLEAIRFDDGAEICNRLTWQGAEDLVSGVRSFIIFRKDFGSPLDFVAIDTISGTQFSYCDTLDSETDNRIVTYKVGSIDNVGNARGASGSQREASIRLLSGPRISYDGSQVMTCPKGLTRVTSDSLSVSWQEFDHTDVTGYEVHFRQPTGAVNRHLIFQPSKKEIAWPLDAGDGVYQIKVRAFYANRDTTIYSNIISVRKKLSLANVQDLTANQDLKNTGDIHLKWAHEDLAEMEAFEIFNWREGEDRPIEPTFVVPGDVFEWTHEAEAYNLVAYQCNYYSVRARDCFGLTSTMEAVVSTYPAIPPTFMRNKTAVLSESVTVEWRRPQPRLPVDRFESVMLVYRDSISSPIDSVSFINDTTYTLYNPLPEHNYLFRVKEVVLDALDQSCSQRYESSFSKTLIVPFENEPDGAPFYVQPLPILPDSTTGKVFVTWQGFYDPAVTHFILEYRTLDSGPVLTNSFIVQADTFLVRGLDQSRRYAFELTSVDSLGQLSKPMAAQAADFNPPWVFTPKIVDMPNCFKDSVTIAWDWVDKSLRPIGGNAGADSVILEFSVDPSFKVKRKKITLAAIKSYTFDRNRHFDFVNSQDAELYVRMGAKDRWGHVSPWSSAFASLGSESGNYDERPPEIAKAVIDSVKAPLFGQAGRVDVYLSWDNAIDNCSGTAQYRVVRDDSVIASVSAEEGFRTFVDRNVISDKSLSTTAWKIYPVDNLGNTQLIAQSATIPLVLTAPAAGGCGDDTTFCWSPSTASLPGFDISYYVEGARFPSLLGNSVTNVIAGPIDGPCYNYNVPWDGIYWRVKAKVGTFESAWSDTIVCFWGPRESVTSVNAEQRLPERFALKQNFPNPFNPSTTIAYDIPKSVKEKTPVLLEIYNVKGQRIRTLVDIKQHAGQYQVLWDGMDDSGGQVASGVYFYRIEVQDFRFSYKMTLVK